MKMFLLRLFFKKELKKIEDMHQKEIKHLMIRENKNRESEIEDMKSIYEIPKRIFFLFKDSKILGIENNRFEEVYVFIEESSPSVYTIGLCSKTYQAINNLPRILANVNTDKNDNHYFYIEDVQVVDKSIGNGSILMKYLIKIALEMKVSYIEGSLSPTDNDHFTRSEKYYKKFHYDVRFTENRSSGSIYLDLSNNEKTSELIEK